MNLPHLQGLHFRKYSVVVLIIDFCDDIKMHLGDLFLSGSVLLILRLVLQRFNVFDEGCYPCSLQVCKLNVKIYPSMITEKIVRPPRL
jgi:hypothetical protein